MKRKQMGNSMLASPLIAQNAAELNQTFTQLQKRYAGFKAQDLKLDLTRGKPASRQLDLSNELLSLPEREYIINDNDYRNYGGLTGIPEIKKIFANLYNVSVDNLIAVNNSSLQLLEIVLNYFYIYGAVDSEQPWGREKKIKILCPVPGYDRHFHILAHLGFELISIPLNADGPDLGVVQELCANDPTVKGLIAVPIFSNPTGITFSAKVTETLLSMKTAAPDFKLILDNAYGIHTLTNTFPEIPDYLSLAKEFGFPNRVVLLFSTSKITFAGAGVAFLALNSENYAWFVQHFQYSTIGPDKINQLRHALFLQSAANVKAHMIKQKNIIAPKFASCLKVLADELSASQIASWTTPEGGYFISLDVLPGTAKRVVALAAAAGVKLTPAGSTFPYKLDVEDKNLRLAPTFVNSADIITATEVVAVCVLLSACEYYLQLSRVEV